MIMRLRISPGCAWAQCAPAHDRCTSPSDRCTRHLRLPLLCMHDRPLRSGAYARAARALCRCSRTLRVTVYVWALPSTRTGHCTRQDKQVCPYSCIRRKSDITRCRRTAARCDGIDDVDMTSRSLWHREIPSGHGPHACGWVWVKRTLCSPGEDLRVPIN